MLAPGIDEEKLVRAVGGGAVGVFARFDVTLRAEDGLTSEILKCEERV